MKEINLPPFYVGQQVICIKTFKKDIDDDEVAPKQNDVLTIRTIETKKLNWYLRFNEIINKRFYYDGDSFLSECHFNVSHFAPIHENFQSISLSKVLETETPLINVN